MGGEARHTVNRRAIVPQKRKGLGLTNPLLPLMRDRTLARHKRVDSERKAVRAIIEDHIVLPAAETI
jgi:hypothetical protein